MGDDTIDEPHGKLQDPPVEIENVVTAARTPPKTKLPDL
jgi:hypothetical protein